MNRTRTPALCQSSTTRNRNKGLWARGTNRASVLRGDDRIPSLLLVVGALALFAQVLGQRWGQITHDTRLDLLLDPGGFLSETWNLWDPTADMGRIQNQAVGYLFPMGPLFFLGSSVGLSPWIVERVWIALLLVVAFWGMARLLDELRIGSLGARVTAAMSFALAPFFIARVGNTSVFVQGAALLPWTLQPLVAGARGGSTRRAAARSGTAVLCMGGVNAVVTGAVLLVPAIWLLTRAPGSRRRSLMGWWALCVVLATSWWVVPLAFQARYALDFLPFTEQAVTTTAASPPFEAVRGMADWLSYHAVGHISLPAGHIEVSSPVVIAASGLVVGLGLFGLAATRGPEKRFLVLTFLVGVALVGIGFGGRFGNPLAGPIREWLTGGGGPLRSVYKFAPLVLVPISIGVALGLDRITRGATSRSRSRLSKNAPVAVTAVLVVLGAWPLFGGDLLHHRPLEGVPTWWADARSFAQSRPGRTLILPGLPESISTWGYTAEEPFEWGTESPWATRSIAPLGSPGATRVLDAIEATVERGGDLALGPYLRRAGFSTVLVRNDGDWLTSGAPSPQELGHAMRASGLTLIESFGPELVADAIAYLPALSVHSIDLYAVPSEGSEHLVSTAPVADSTVLSGDAASILALERADLSTGAAVLAQDLRAGDPVPPRWIVTDGNKRAPTWFGLNRRNRGYVLTPDEQAPGGFLPDEQPEDQTVARRLGIDGVRASSYGSWMVPVPEVAPPMAIDGDVRTAWAAAADLEPTSQWLQVDLLRDVEVPSIRVSLLRDGSWRPKVGALEVTTETGSRITAVHSDERWQQLEVPPGATGWIRIGFESVEVGQATTGPGLREVAIPGVDVEHLLETPHQLDEAFSSPEANAPTFVFERATAIPTSLLRSDPEPQLHRAWSVPRASQYDLRVTVAVEPTAALLQILGTAPDGSITASSTLGNLPGFGPSNLLDDNPDTTWVPGTSPDAAATLDAAGSSGRNQSGSVTSGTAPTTPEDTAPVIRVRWPSTRTVDQVHIGRVPSFALPESIRLVTDRGDVREARIGADGTATFRPLEARGVDITFPDVARHRILGRQGALVDRPLSLSSLTFPDVPDLGRGLHQISDSARDEVGCSEGPTVAIDGTVHHLQLSASRQELAEMRPVPAQVCASDQIRLSTGRHRLDTTTGTSPFVVESVILSPSSERAPSPTPDRGVIVKRWDPDHRELTVEPGPASYLVIAENANQGWHATLEGTELRPVMIDGWKQGFVLPNGGDGHVALTFTPTRPYRTGLVIGGLLAGCLLALAIAPEGRRPGGPAVGTAVGTPVLVVAVVVGTTVLISGPLAFLLVPLTWFARRRQSACAVLALVSFGAASIWAGATQASVRTHLGGTFGWPTTVATLLAVLLVAATVTAGPSAPPTEDRP